MNEPSYTFRWPLGVVDPLCPEDHPIAESTDRRLLWHLETQLAISATNETLHNVQRNLVRYLRDTCEHHWHHYGAETHIPEHRQCLWCNDVEWADADGS